MAPFVKWVNNHIAVLQKQNHSYAWPELSTLTNLSSVSSWNYCEKVLMY